MLVLRRSTRPGKNAVVLTDGAGNQIRIMVLENQGGQVALGFEAPPGVLILREEVPRRE